VEQGFVMSYVPDPVEVARSAAGYVDRILRGAKPGDLPVEQPSRFRLAINTRTANAMGLTIRKDLLARADW
jgi:putative ABC transport system substrate-binding protein